MSLVAHVKISHMKVIILVIPRCASSVPLYGSSRTNPFSAGNLATQGYRFRLLQDVTTDRVHYMLTSGAHVPSVACGSTCKI